MNRVHRHILFGVISTAAAFVVLAFIVYAAWVVFLVFAGTLLAILLRTLSAWLQRFTPLGRVREGWSLLVAVGGLVLVIGALLGWIAPHVAGQADELTRQLPRAWNQLKSQIQDYGWGRWLFNRMAGTGSGGNGMEQIEGQVMQQAKRFAWNAFYFLTSAVVIIFLGLYLAVQTRLYISAIVRLVPPRHRGRAQQVLDQLGHTLSRWLMGRIASMLIIGFLSWLGLWLLGVPLALTLGLIAALLTFIPNLGPVLSVIPAALIGFSQSPLTAVWVLLLYLGIQTVESYLITPLIQEQAVSIPPGLTITAQVLMGLLAGGLGLLLATPATASVIVLVKMLYMRDTLGDTEVRDGL